MKMDSRENLLTVTEASQIPLSATEIWNRSRNMLHFNAFVLSKNSFGSLCPVPSKIRRRSSSSSIVADYTARDTTTAATSQSRRTISAQEARLSLVFALASQASTLSQRGNVSVFYLMIDSTRSLSSYLNSIFFRLACSFVGIGFWNFEILVA